MESRKDTKETSPERSIYMLKVRWWVYDHNIEFRCELMDPNLSKRVCQVDLNKQLTLESKDRSRREALDAPQSLKLGTVARWFKTCEESHSKCREYFATRNWLPSRLIDIHSLAREHKVVVISTNDLDPDIHYATLSHRWGRPVQEPLHLTTSSQEELQNAIDQNLLPKTFLETIRLLRGVGIRYLWIDTLCILQDRVEDWQKVAATMGRVYENSYLNVAASAAKDGTQGLFPTVAERIESFALIYLRTKLREEFCLKFNDRDLVRLQNEPLHNRGWVVQEVVLSRRVICFGPKQIHCRCPESSKLIGDVEDESDEFRSISPKLDLLRPPKADVNLDLQWGDMMAVYFGTQLTHATDRLVALAGLAERYQVAYKARNIDTDYVAGLWTHRLVGGLLFFHQSELERTSNQYIAPSWSWAARQGQPGYIRMAPAHGTWYNYEEFLHLNKIEAQPVDGNNPFGQVKSAYLDCFLPSRYVLLEVQPEDRTSYQATCHNHPSVSTLITVRWDYVHDRSGIYLLTCLAARKGGVLSNLIRPGEAAGLILQKQSTTGTYNTFKRVGHWAKRYKFVNYDYENDNENDNDNGGSRHDVLQGHEDDKVMDMCRVRDRASWMRVIII